jgi:glyoxylase-like metal-dependent hydrolase (beta-lactamase superfamily II)
MKLNKVSKHIYANWDGETGGNVGIIELDEEIVVIDAQYPESAKNFKKAIKDLSNKPLSHLFLTHIHGDHVFGNQVFEDLEIVSHINLKTKMKNNLENEWTAENLEKMLEAIKKDTPERLWLFNGLKIVLPTLTFEKVFKLDKIEFIHTGGHTDCSSIVYDPLDKVVFAGDLLFVNRFPWAGDITADPDTWIEAFKTMLKMDVEKIIPGHGPLCDLDEIEKQLAWFKTMRDEMKGLIADGASEEQVANHMYPELYPTDRFEWQKQSYRRWYKVWTT